MYTYYVFTERRFCIQGEKTGEMKKEHSEGNMKILEIKNSRDEKFNSKSLRKYSERSRRFKKSEKESKIKRLVQELQSVNKRSSREQERRENRRQKGVNHK